MLSWRQYLIARESFLAAEGEPIKTSGEPTVGFDMLVPGAAADDFPGLIQHVRRAIDNPDRYFAVEGSIPIQAAGRSLSFRSPLAGSGSDAVPNDIARAVLFPARGSGRAIVLLPHWNSLAAEYQRFARMLANMGITCLQVTLPYHDQRQTPGAGFARELVSENLGLTIRTNRQAIIETRAWLGWLEQQGYRYLGIVGVSIGSCIASIVAALDSRVKAAVLLLMADDFADVVWTGTATRHLKESLARRFSLDELRSAWAPISPSTYYARLCRRLRKLLIVSGALDTVFVPPLTQAYVERLRNCGLEPDWLSLACGHYTLSLPPYSVLAAVRTVSHLRSRLR